jgi:type IX secretion system PorP/SprF family membrane protein
MNIHFNLKFSPAFVLIFLMSSLGPNAFAGNNDTIKTNASMSVDISHFLFNNIIMNPAYTGISESENLLLHASIDKPMASFSPLYHLQEYLITNDYSFFKKKSNAIGIYCMQSAAGATQSFMPGISYAHCFNLPFSRSGPFYHKLRVGVSVSYSQYEIDYSKLSWSDQIDPRYGFVYYTAETMPSNTTHHYFSADAGIWYYNYLAYFGFAVKNLNQPDVGSFAVSKVPMEYNLSAGGRIFINKHFALHPSFIANLISGYKVGFNSYNPALLAAYNEKYFLGLSYNDMNKISVQAGAMLWKILVNFECAYATSSYMTYYGNPTYIGGNIRMLLNKHKIKQP